MEEGTSANFGFTAEYTGDPGGTVVADVAVGGRRYTLDGEPTASGKSYRVNLATVPFPVGGATTSHVTFRLCTTASCSAIYPGSTKQFTVNLDVKVKDWATFQRDNAHTGYVPVRYNVEDFEKAWEYQDEFGDGRIRPPAAARGIVLTVAARDGGIAYNGTARLKAFDAATGAVRWTYDMGDQFHSSGPSLSGNLVHVTSMVSSSNTNPQWVFDLATGAFKNQMHFAAQWTDFNQPAADGKNVYIAAGNTGGVVYGYDALAGTKLWETTRTGGMVWGGQSMALDDRYAYYYSGVALDQINRATGAIVRSIADPYYEQRVYDYESGPVLDGEDNVYLFSSDKGFTDRNHIIGMSLASGTVLWRSAAEYTAAFAYKDGVIYAVRQDAHVLSAINAASGDVMWSTRLPGSDPLLGNVIVTENLVFASSGTQTWAVDLKQTSHPVVWEAPTGGRLAITPDNYLLTTGARGTSKLTAYRLF